MLTKISLVGIYIIDNIYITLIRNSHSSNRHQNN